MWKNFLRFLTGMLPVHSDAPFAYSKACGIISKSFTGKKLSALSGLHSLNELDRLVFPDDHRELPGHELLLDLEHRLVDRAVRQILAIIEAYQKPPLLLVRMLKVYEYGDLKACLHVIIPEKDAPPSKIPHVADLGSFKTVNFKAFPDIGAMVNGTEFEFIVSDIKAGVDITEIEAKLDMRYYLGLIESLAELSAEDCDIAQKVLEDEICLRNCVWAFRLRSYYQKTAAQTAKQLLDIKMPKKARNGTSLAAPALLSLDFPLDTRSSWQGWRWEKLLNPEESSAHWSVNPRYFQNAASQYIYHLTMRSFHKIPMSTSALFCFIKIKQFEEDLLTSFAEGLALGMDSAEVFKLLEATA
ncbi:MAG: V-type ATPase subunit [Treponema sp.]|jgi:vacuolar-type H+-ATPase subunit C/Vma6|nr:V-type ATPase subunit [Treponema sp.]